MTDDADRALVLRRGQKSPLDDYVLAILRTRPLLVRDIVRTLRRTTGHPVQPTTVYQVCMRLYRRGKVKSDVHERLGTRRRFYV